MSIRSRSHSRERDSRDRMRCRESNANASSDDEIIERPLNSYQRHHKYYPRYQNNSNNYNNNNARFNHYNNNNHNKMNFGHFKPHHNPSTNQHHQIAELRLNIRELNATIVDKELLVKQAELTALTREEDVKEMGQRHAREIKSIERNYVRKIDEVRRRCDEITVRKLEEKNTEIADLKRQLKASFDDGERLRIILKMVNTRNERLVEIVKDFSEGEVRLKKETENKEVQVNLDIRREDVDESREDSTQVDPINEILTSDLEISSPNNDNLTELSDMGGESQNTHQENKITQHIDQNNSACDQILHLEVNIALDEYLSVESTENVEDFTSNLLNSPQVDESLICLEESSQFDKNLPQDDETLPEDQLNVEDNQIFLEDNQNSSQNNPNSPQDQHSHYENEIQADEEESTPQTIDDEQSEEPFNQLEENLIEICENVQMEIEITSCGENGFEESFGEFETVELIGIKLSEDYSDNENFIADTNIEKSGKHSEFNENIDKLKKVMDMTINVENSAEKLDLCSEILSKDKDVNVKYLTSKSDLNIENSKDNYEMKNQSTDSEKHELKNDNEKTDKLSENLPQIISQNINDEFKGPFSPKNITNLKKCDLKPAKSDQNSTSKIKAIKVVYKKDLEDKIDEQVFKEDEKLLENVKNSPQNGEILSHNEEYSNLTHQIECSVKNTKMQEKLPQSNRTKSYNFKADNLSDKKSFNKPTDSKHSTKTEQFLKRSNELMRSGAKLLENSQKHTTQLDKSLDDDRDSSKRTNKIISSPPKKRKHAENYAEERESEKTPTYIESSLSVVSSTTNDNNTDYDSEKLIKKFETSTEDKATSLLRGSLKMDLGEEDNDGYESKPSADVSDSLFNRKQLRSFKSIEQQLAEMQGDCSCEETGIKLKSRDESTANDALKLINDSENTQRLMLCDKNVAESSEISEINNENSPLKLSQSRNHQNFYTLDDLEDISDTSLASVEFNPRCSNLKEFDQDNPEVSTNLDTKNTQLVVRERSIEVTDFKSIETKPEVNNNEELTIERNYEAQLPEKIKIEDSETTENLNSDVYDQAGTESTESIPKEQTSELFNILSRPTTLKLQKTSISIEQSTSKSLEEDNFDQNKLERQTHSALLTSSKVILKEPKNDENSVSLFSPTENLKLLSTVASSIPLNDKCVDKKTLKTSDDNVEKSNNLETHRKSQSATNDSCENLIKTRQIEEQQEEEVMNMTAAATNEKPDIDERIKLIQTEQINTIALQSVVTDNGELPSSIVYEIEQMNPVKDLEIKCDSLDEKVREGNKENGEDSKVQKVVEANLVEGAKINNNDNVVQAIKDDFNFKNRPVRISLISNQENNLQPAGDDVQPKQSFQKILLRRYSESQKAETSPKNDSTYHIVRDPSYQDEYLKQLKIHKEEKKSKKKKAKKSKREKESAVPEETFESEILQRIHGKPTKLIQTTQEDPNTAIVNCQVAVGGSVNVTRSIASDQLVPNSSTCVNNQRIYSSRQGGLIIDHRDNTQLNLSDQNFSRARKFADEAQDVAIMSQMLSNSSNYSDKSASFYGMYADNSQAKNNLYHDDVERPHLGSQSLNFQQDALDIACLPHNSVNKTANHFQDLVIDKQTISKDLKSKYKDTPPTTGSYQISTNPQGYNLDFVDAQRVYQAFNNPSIDITPTYKAAHDKILQSSDPRMVSKLLNDQRATTALQRLHSETLKQPVINQTSTNQPNLSLKEINTMKDLKTYLVQPNWSRKVTESLQRAPTAAFDLRKRRNSMYVHIDSVTTIQSPITQPNANKMPPRRLSVYDRTTSMLSEPPRRLSIFESPPAVNKIIARRQSMNKTSSTAPTVVKNDFTQPQVKQPQINRSCSIDQRALKRPLELIQCATPIKRLCNDPASPCSSIPSPYSSIPSPSMLLDETSKRRLQNKNEISQIVIEELSRFYEFRKFGSDNPKVLFKSMARAVTYYFHMKDQDAAADKSAIKDYIMEVFYVRGIITSSEDFLLKEE